MAHHLETDVPPRMFKKILDDSDDGYMIADARGVVVYTNTAYLKVSDRLEAGMTGHNMREYIEDGSLEDSNALRAIEERRQVVQPLMIRNEVPLSVTSTPFFGEEGELEYVVTVTQDISLLSDTKQKLDNLLRLLEKHRMPGKDMPGGGEDFVAVSAGMRRVFDLADKIKNTMPTVIVYGESGVGKDVVA
ncbi:PAS domain S-box protein, partial [Desulfovibrio sp. OttesenSCG-928-I05]|nr:PAS domain S-box protein [Desulfovibrio sp. OttesenSCG-928-I05]